MSLETALGEHTAAIKENTAASLKLVALLDESNRGREAVLAKIDAKTGGKDTLAATTALVAPTEGTRGRGRPPNPKDTPAASAKPAAPKPPAHATVDDVRAAAVSFITTDDEDLKSERKVFMKAIIDHLGIAEDEKGRRPLTNALPEDRANVIKWLTDKGAGKTVNFSEGEDAAVEVDEDDIG